MSIMSLPWYVIALAALVGIIGSARVTRIVTWDAFPPAAWIRQSWARLVRDTAWAKLVTCAWCFGPWAFLVSVLWFLATFSAEWVAWSWWIFHVWMAGSYLVSQYVYFDEGKPDGE